MRRAIIGLVAAMALTLTGLTLGPSLRAIALGNTQVTLDCSDGTSFTVVVDTDTLAELTAAVQGMLDYPAGLSCTLIQVPLLTSFGHIAVAATDKTFLVAGGRWLVACSAIFFYRAETSVPAGIVARGATRPALAKIVSPAPLASTACPIDELHGCVVVNIGVNLHFNGSGLLEGTLNETIPENQFCPNPTTGDPDVAVGPTHFTSKPTPPPPSEPSPGCLETSDDLASTKTIVTQISGLAFPPGTPGVVGFTGLQPNDAVYFLFLDNGNPSQWTADMRDMLEGPPASNASTCPGTATPGFDFERGNLNVHP